MIFTDYAKERTARVELALQSSLVLPDSVPDRLIQAMSYAVLQGGKRIRPLLVYATGEALAAQLEVLDMPACAVELIHSYSLIHDDLPAMDNADLRRGLPSCHKAFDEATAILAGDALLPLALQIIAGEIEPGFTVRQKLLMIKELVYAAGAAGMVGGQLVDLSLSHNANNKSLTLTELENIYQKKTGALIHACINLGIIAANCEDPQLLESLYGYAAAIGLGFQIQDDILDIEVSTEALGKPQGKDAAMDKITVPSLIGIRAAKDKVRALHQEALDSLSPLGDQAVRLRQLASFLCQRES